MQSESARTGGIDREQACLRQRQHRADLLVGSVSTAAHWNDHVVAVVATE